MERLNRLVDEMDKLISYRFIVAIKKRNVRYAYESEHANTMAANTFGAINNNRNILGVKRLLLQTTTTTTTQNSTLRRRRLAQQNWQPINSASAFRISYEFVNTHQVCRVVFAQVASQWHRYIAWRALRCVARASAGKPEMRAYAVHAWKAPTPTRSTNAEQSGTSH